MGETIRVRLDAKSIRSAIRRIERYQNRLSTIRQNICEWLAAIGMQDASVRFASAVYDGTNDASLSVEATQTGYRVIASGNSVAFIEFGTGVHHNPGGGAYPIKKPEGIVGIGEYGKGMGKRDSWRYRGETGTNGEAVMNEKTGEVLIKTHGNPAQMPMYNALIAMQGEAERIVREAFNHA